VVQKFWKRQYSAIITPLQLQFDLIFGGVIPIILFIADPLVFRTIDPCESPFFGDYAFFAYFAVSLGILTLAAWLLIPTLRQSGAPFFAGVMLTGTIFALGLGVVLLPFSLIGLIILIGAAGFLPFLSMFVYYRNARRAIRLMKAAKRGIPQSMLGMLAGVIFAIGIPAFAHMQLTNSIQQSVDRIAGNIVRPDEAAIESLRQLNTLCFHICAPNIATAFKRAESKYGGTFDGLENFYRKITGGNLNKHNCSPWLAGG
jgi:hypothetical protein